ncbi:MAG: UDP-2,3-diacylglucosamine diphosphatase LpxI [Pirellulaceae bacterium]|nr:UDP-2,3-diacylglucosamine diphosphatase LpxI [Pirellulaceae bacterium]
MSSNSRDTSNAHHARRLGLIAGWGRFPLVLAEALHAQGYQVFGLGIKDHADPSIESYCTEYRELGIARMGAAIRLFRRWDVRQATMAGKVHKARMFQPLAFWKHFPDLKTAQVFYRSFVTMSRDRRDDTLLSTVVRAFADEGIELAAATDFAPELLVNEGLLSGRPLSARQRKDVQFGWQLAKEMGRLDVGQSVAVKDQAVLAIEAIEGTDECIRRAGRLCPSGGFTLVKVAKPQQDMRFDVPTVGLGTLRALVEAGGRVLAIEAGKTIVIDQPEVVAFAERHQLTVVALRAEHIEQVKPWPAESAA